MACGLSMGGGKSSELQGAALTVTVSHMEGTCLRGEPRLQLTWALGVSGMEPIQDSS